MEDKELKKRLKKIPDVDKNGDPIYKIAETSKPSGDKTRNSTDLGRKMIKTDTCF